MAQCSKTNCKKPATKDGLCADHARLKAQQDQKDKQVKEQMAKKLAENQDKIKKAAELQKKNQVTKEAKDKEIVRIAALWNAQVTTVVTAVKGLRKLNPGNNGINAGNNANVIVDSKGTKGSKTIPGGTNNPIAFTVPSNSYGITKADIGPKVTGFDSSDSGTFKFRRDGILVHGK